MRTFSPTLPTRECRGNDSVFRSLTHLGGVREPEKSLKKAGKTERYDVRMAHLYTGAALPLPYVRSARLGGGDIRMSRPTIFPVKNYRYRPSTSRFTRSRSRSRATALAWASPPLLSRAERTRAQSPSAVTSSRSTYRSWPIYRRKARTLGSYTTPTRGTPWPAAKMRPWRRMETTAFMRERMAVTLSRSEAPGSR